MKNVVLLCKWELFIVSIANDRMYQNYQSGFSILQYIDDILIAVEYHCKLLCRKQYNRTVMLQHITLYTSVRSEKKKFLFR